MASVMLLIRCTSNNKTSAHTQQHWVDLIRLFINLLISSNDLPLHWPKRSLHTSAHSQLTTRTLNGLSSCTQHFEKKEEEK